MQLFCTLFGVSKLLGEELQAEKLCGICAYIWCWISRTLSDLHGFSSCTRSKAGGTGHNKIHLKKVLRITSSGHWTPCLSRPHRRRGQSGWSSLPWISYWACSRGPTSWCRNALTSFWTSITVQNGQRSWRTKRPWRSCSRPGTTTRPWTPSCWTSCPSSISTRRASSATVCMATPRPTVTSCARRWSSWSRCSRWGPPSPRKSRLPSSPGVFLGIHSQVVRDIIKLGRLSMSLGQACRESEFLIPWWSRGTRGL